MLEEDFEQYAVSLEKALRADAELHQTLDRVRRVLPERQAALDSSQLRLRAM